MKASNVCAGLLLASSLPVSMRSQAHPKPKSFDVASVKVNKANTQARSGGASPSGLINIRNVTMKEILELTYHIGNGQMANPPNWVGVDRFDISAKGQAGDTPEDIREKMRNLLAERFKLAAHLEQREMDVFVLAVSHDGPKLAASKASSDDDGECVPGNGVPRDRHFVCRHITMEQLAKRLQVWAPAYVDRLVVDETKLAGAFDFRLDWTPAGFMNIGGPGQNTPSGSAQPVTPATAGVTLPDALEGELGLRLSRAKRRMPVLVFDHIERVPTEN